PQPGRRCLAEAVGSHHAGGGCGASDRLAGKRWLFGDEPHLQRGSRSNPTYRHRHGTWLLRSTSDTREHRRELRKGRIDRGLLRAGFVRARVMAVLATDTCDWLRTSVNRLSYSHQRLPKRRAACESRTFVPNASCFIEISH